MTHIYTRDTQHTSAALAEPVKAAAMVTKAAESFIVDDDDDDDRGW
jgi:hypothetical protein